jgi:hypothetical protein
LKIETVTDVEELIDNEWYIVRYSGETPEIAYNSAIYFLTRAVDGPGIILEPGQVSRLKQAAVDRYEEIVLRDLYHENVGKSIYRGVARSICNFQRLSQFSIRQDLNKEEIKGRASTLFATFLEIEFDRISQQKGGTIINCSFSELESFAVTLGTPFLPAYSIFKPHCPETSQ